MVDNIKDKLEAAREQINTVINLKTLHDHLHYLQVSLYNPIVGELRHFPDESAYRNLANWARQVKYRAQWLWPNATSVYPEKTEAEWVGELVEAAETLREGAEARDAVKVDYGIWGLNEVLSTRPSEVNTDLLNGIRRMDLRELFRELMRIGDEMRRLNVATDDVRKFTAGGCDLGRLDRDLEDLMKQHNRWQDIDGQLRRIENNLKGHPRELDAAWPKLYKALQEQLDLVAPSHHDGLRDAVEGVVGVMAEAAPNAKYWPFMQLRDMAVEWFQTLDTTLLGRCNELKAIDFAIRLILGIIQKPTSAGEPSA